jgi:IPT/TIG domain
VTAVSPNAGAPAGGDIVTLTGTGFEAAGTPITSQVTVGLAPAITPPPCVTSPTAPCFTVNSATSITIEQLPPGTGMVHITVTTPGGTSAMTSADVYTYVTTFPNVVTVSPKFGAASGGAYVTVVGSNFGDPSQGFGATHVVFGSKDIPVGNTFPCTGSANGCFEQIGTTTLDVYTPAVAAGTVHIKVITPGGPSNPGIGDEYTFVARGAYSTISPFRICDTRPAGGGIAANQCDTAGKGTLVPGRETITVQITGAQIPAGAQAVVANISAIDHGSGSTFITAFPAGGSQPLASNINVAGGKVEGNLAIVQLSSGGQISLFNSVGSADVIVDLEGYFSTTTGGPAGAFHSIPPLRICDSRAVPGNATLCAKASGSTSDPLIGGTWRRLVVSGVPPGSSATGIPTDGTAAAAVFNLTGTAGSAPTYLSVTAPNGSDACPTKAPAFANLNPTPGISLGNRVISNLGIHQDICLFSAAGSINFIIDVNGWFGKTGAAPGAFFYSVPPTRICDTRPSDGTRCQGQQLTANHSQLIAVAGIVAVPAWNLHAPPPLAVVANLTGIAGSASTYLTLYPTDVTPHPTASDLNLSAGEVIGDLGITSLAQTGSTLGDDYLYNAVGTINAVLDVAGWFQ